VPCCTRPVTSRRACICVRACTALAYGRPPGAPPWCG
jgi:hypothetical protein